MVSAIDGRENKIKTQLKSSVIPIALAIFCSAILLSLHFWVEPAYAVTYQEITTTDAQTEDNCSFISQDFHLKLWMICGSTVADASPNLNVYDSAGIRKNQTATFCVGSGVSVDNSGTQLMISFDDASNLSYTIIKCGGGASGKFEKWRFDKSNNHLDLVGSYQPSSCTIVTTNGARYDTNGYIWFACTTEDKVIAFNPTTMIEKFRSSDLSNGVGTDCVAPRAVGADYVNSANIRFIVSCDTTDRIEVFHINVNLVDNSWVMASSEPDGSVAETITSSANSQMLVDPNHNRVWVDFASGALGLDTFTYSQDTGSIIAENTDLGNHQVQWCYTDSYLVVSSTRSTYVYCVGNGAGSNNLQIFLGNVTGVYQVVNSADILTDSFSRISTWGSDTAYISMGLKNAGYQKFGLISDLSALEIVPSNPNEGAGTNNTNTHCAPAFADRNGDGICDNPAFTTCSDPSATDCHNPLDIPNIGCNTFVMVGVLPSNTTSSDCHTNVKTNGVGYGLWAVLLLVSLALSGYAVKGKKTDDLHIVLYVAALIGTSAFASAVGWIDSTLFYIMIVVSIGFASLKLYNFVEGKLQKEAA